MDIKYWGLASLSKIGSLIGQPLRTDKYTAEKSRLSFARLLIVVPLEGSFPEYVEFFNEKDVLIRQPVKFEWCPSKCTFCGMFGHSEEICRKKPPPKKVWRRVEKENNSDPNPSVFPNNSHSDNIQTVDQEMPPDRDTNAFTLVSKKSAARTVLQHSFPQTQSTNSFQLLQSNLEAPQLVEHVPEQALND